MSSNNFSFSLYKTVLPVTIRHFQDLDSLKYFNRDEKYFISKCVLRVPQKSVTNNKLTEKEINIMSSSKTMQINYMGFISSNYVRKMKQET